MIHGKNRIGFQLEGGNGQSITSFNPANDEVLDGQFQLAGDDQINTALDKAETAFEAYSTLSDREKADFLEAIGEEILALGDELVQRAMAETALPEGRIKGERGRTVGQLNLFASLLREGSWVDATIDTALPERSPIPKPDIRTMLVPVGPVVVFTASNFPLAFSTAGGDTASALAAGNPVIVKAHESHLGTNELVSNAISKAAERTGMPDGVFSSLNGSGYELGQKLVLHPKTRSVAFTGSLNGGRALHKLAGQREEPIPVFAEMGSINPVFILPEKLGSDPRGLAKTYAGSITLGAGQFCTNPGLLVGIKSDKLDDFAEELAKTLGEIHPHAMLNSGIAAAYRNRRKSTLDQEGVELLSENEDPGSNNGQPTVAVVAASAFISEPQLHNEVFGPFSLLVQCDNKDEMADVAAHLEGQLTTTFMASDKDVKEYEDVISKASLVTGRLIFNGVPTGVEVCHSMHHGGPYPASTDGRYTSVGTEAIKRFVRPLCYQSCPANLLPAALADENSLGIWRKVNGQLTRDSI